MKFQQKKRMTSWTRLVPAALALSLVACGGSGSTSGGSSKPAIGPTTGILTDAKVAGVAYLTSSGTAGTTNEGGVFNYTHGDTIEFKLGSLIIGKVKAAPIVTPIELAADSSTRLQNLLILLQSLDMDGKPENGISIPANAAAVVGAAINLDSDPATFAASAELQKVREAGGITGEVKTAAQANAHFLSQGMKLLSTDIWVNYDGTTANVIRTSTAGTGEYLQGEATPDDSCDVNRVCGRKVIITAGVEYGAASVSEFDTRGFKFVGAPIIDTNLQAGLSHPRPKWRIRVDGSALVATDIVAVATELRRNTAAFDPGSLITPTVEGPVKTEVQERRFPRMENDPLGIVGAWVLETATIKTQTFLFFPNGKFLLVDPIGDLDQAGHASCGGPGVEFASYTHDAATKALNIKGFTYNTNGCAGLSENEATAFKLGADGNTAILETKNGTAITLHRVSQGRL